MRPFGPGANGMALSPYPRLDVVDKDDAYEIKPDLPGVKRDDVKIHVNGKDVEIAVEMSSEKTRKMKRHCCSWSAFTAASSPG